MKSNPNKFTRGELAKTTNVNSETIRYYEKIGLIQTPSRSVGGHRIYADQHLNRVSFIRRCRELGFSLKEIRDLIELVDSGHYTGDGVFTGTTLQAKCASKYDTTYEGYEANAAEGT